MLFFKYSLYFKKMLVCIYFFNRLPVYLETSLFVVQLLSHVRLCNTMDCSTPGFPVLHNSWSLLKLMSIELVVPSNHLILCCPLLFLPSIFPRIKLYSNESAFRSGGQSMVDSLELTGLISLQSKGLSKVFSTPNFESISSSGLSLLYCPAFTSLHDYWRNHSFD